MKTNHSVKDEPMDFHVEKLFRLYSCNKSPKTKTINNQDQEPSTCAWCQKLGLRSFTIRADNGETKNICSEVCFNHYRRASFKKNRGLENDVEQNSFPNLTIAKSKSPEKKKRDQQQQLIGTSRRKIFKSTEISQVPSPPSLSSSKHHRSSSPPPTTQLLVNPSNNLPISLTWQSSLFPWSCPIDINRFQYPFLPPPPPPPPHLPVPLPVHLPSTVASPSSSSSDLFTTLSKGVISNVTCILPTFLPLPIPIPILIPSRCSIEVNHQQTQTNSTDFPKRIRRTSV